MPSVNRIQAAAAWQNSMNGEQMAQNDALRASYTGTTANSQAALARAQALGATTSANLAPGLAKSQIGLQATQAGENVARAGYYGSQSGFTDAQTAMERAKLRSGRYMTDAIAANIGANIPQPSVTPPPAPQPSSMLSPSPMTSSPPSNPSDDEEDDLGLGGWRFSKGTARVPGKGSGKVDTVPAKLAPGEAVLNKGANDAMPQGLVAALNAMGAAKMGLTAPDAGQQTPTTPGYAKGTSNVRSPSKRSDTPLLTPQMMQMLMQAQGGGAPQGGGGILTADPRAQALGMP